MHSPRLCESQLQITRRATTRHREAVVSSGNRYPERERDCSVKCKDAQYEGASTQTGHWGLLLLFSYMTTAFYNLMAAVFVCFKSLSYMKGVFVVGWLPRHAGWKFTRPGLYKPALALLISFLNFTSLTSWNSLNMLLLCCLETVFQSSECV